MKKLHALFSASRPISWVNTAYPFAAGYLIATRAVTWQFIVGTLFFLIPYNLLMYGINDVFDYESDILNPRKGGIEGATNGRELHRLIIISSIGLSLPFIAVLVSLGSWSAKLIFIYIIFMVIAYSAPKLRFKERPILDSFTSSTHFTGPLLFAWALTGWTPSWWPYVVAFFLWGMASHAFGAVQDIRADRAGGIASVGTVLGPRKTTLGAIGCYAVATVLVASQGWRLLPIAGCGLLYIISILPFVHVTEENCEIAHAGWRRFLWLNWISGAVITITLILHFRG
jgi:4-hydroxybenzoate polyprenyltransferase